MNRWLGNQWLTLADVEFRALHSVSSREVFSSGPRSLSQLWPTGSSWGLSTSIAARHFGRHRAERIKKDRLPQASPEISQGIRTKRQIEVEKGRFLGHNCVVYA